MQGGVAGGSILRGVLREGDEIEIRPGIMTKSGDCVPIHSRIVSLFAEKNTLKYAVPGGLIGVGTKIDPILTRSDRLVGQVRVLQKLNFQSCAWRASACCGSGDTFN